MSENSVSRRQFSFAVTGGVLSLLASTANSKRRSTETSKRTQDLASLTLAEAASLLQTGRTTSTALVHACLERIADEGVKTNAFTTVMREQALAQAHALDAEAAANKFRSPLHGIPIALKDNIDTAGVRTTWASAIFADRAPDANAAVVDRLQAAGAVVIGKTNLGELTMSASSAISHFGPTRNPWALDRITGGSSGGSGAAPAAKCCYGALGTDSGGSVRIPAAYCDLVALKPTYGSVSMRGILSSSRSFDTCGPMARSVEDVAMLFDAIVGYDPLDIASSDRPPENYRTLMQQPVSGLRVGIPRKPYFDGLDPEIGKSVEAALHALGALTRSVKDIELPPASDHILEVAEYFAYHHRLQQQGYVEQYRKFRPDLLIENREWPPAEKCGETLDAYVQGRWDLEQLRRTADRAFADFDVVALPTMKYMPPRVAEVLKNGEAGPNGQTLFMNTRPFNVYGWPAIALPCGFSSSGLPIGLMIAGPKFSEGKLLALAYAYEQRFLSRARQS